MHSAEQPHPDVLKMKDETPGWSDRKQTWKSFPKHHKRIEVFFLKLASLASFSDFYHMDEMPLWHHYDYSKTFAAWFTPQAKISF